MGEAGSDPAAQFAVAATINNRLQAGNFPGVSGGAYGVVNAPSQYVGFSATPNASAQAFADAIDQGTLGQYGNVGNATFFQTAGSNTTLGRNPNTTNIGGNNFSDAWGNPTANFQAPQFNGFGTSTGVADNASGGTPASDQSLFGSIFGGPGSQRATGTGTSTAAGSGSQPNWVKAITTWLEGIGASVQGWLTRGFLIIIGLVVAAIGVIHLMSPGTIERTMRKVT
jgi:hypothetical protein